MRSTKSSASALTVLAIASAVLVAPSAQAVQGPGLPGVSARVATNCTQPHTNPLVVEGMSCDQGWSIVQSPAINKAVSRNKDRFTIQKLTCRTGPNTPASGYWVSCTDRKDPKSRWLAYSTS